MPVTPAAVSAPASSLPCCEDLLSPAGGTRRAPCLACSAAFCLSASAPWNSGSLDFASCSSLTFGVGHLLVGLVLAGLEVDLLGRGGLGHGAGGRDRARPAPGAPGPERGDLLGHGLGLVGRRLGRGLDVLGRALLALGDHALDLALDLARLPGLLVVVGLLEGLRRLGLDRGLHRGDERLLVEGAGLLGVHRVDLRGLGLAGDVVGRRERGVLGLLGLRTRPAGAPSWRFAKPLTLPFTWANAGSSAGCTPAAPRAAAAACPSAAARGHDGAGAAAAPPRHRSPGALPAPAWPLARSGRLRRLRAALPSGRDRLDRLGWRHRLLGGRQHPGRTRS